MPDDLVIDPVNTSGTEAAPAKHFFLVNDTRVDSPTYVRAVKKALRALAMELAKQTSESDTPPDMWVEGYETTLLKDENLNYDIFNASATGDKVLRLLPTNISTYNGPEGIEEIHLTSEPNNDEESRVGIVLYRNASGQLCIPLAQGDILWPATPANLARTRVGQQLLTAFVGAVPYRDEDEIDGPARPALTDREVAALVAQLVTASEEKEWQEERRFIREGREAHRATRTKNNSEKNQQRRENKAPLTAEEQQRLEEEIEEIDALRKLNATRKFLNKTRDTAVGVAVRQQKIVLRRELSITELSEELASRKEQEKSDPVITAKLASSERKRARWNRDLEKLARGIEKKKSFLTEDRKLAAEARRLATQAQENAIAATAAYEIQKEQFEIKQKKNHQDSLILTYEQITLLRLEATHSVMQQAATKAANALTRRTAAVERAQAALTNAAEGLAVLNAARDRVVKKVLRDARQNLKDKTRSEQKAVARAAETEAKAATILQLAQQAGEELTHYKDQNPAVVAAVAAARTAHSKTLLAAQKDAKRIAEAAEQRRQNSEAAANAEATRAANEAEREARRDRAHQDRLAAAHVEQKPANPRRNPYTQSRDAQPKGTQTFHPPEDAKTVRQWRQIHCPKRPIQAGARPSYAQLYYSPRPRFHTPNGSR